MPVLDHVGIAVADPEAVAGLYRRLLNVLPYKQEAVADQGVRTHFLDGGGAKLELLEALSGDSPVARHLERRGEGLHHLAFEVPDLPAAMQRLRGDGFRLLSDAPQQGGDDKRIAFLHPKDTHGVLVELCESAGSALSPSLRARGDGTPDADGRLAVYTAGRESAPSVLLLHGPGGCADRDLRPLMRRLEPRAHVIALDVSGHGNSRLPDRGALSVDRLAADAVAALDATETEAAHVVGLSAGGTVALALGRDCPDRVAGVAVHATPALWDADTTARLRARLKRTGAARGGGPEDASDRRPCSHAGGARLAPALDTLLGSLGTVSLPHPEPGIPILISASDDDRVVPPETAVSMRQAVSCSRLAVLPGPLDAPHAQSAFVESLKAHLLA
jgi:methylmalonyl-CoA epimerase